jgi:hypothetical protein
LITSFTVAYLTWRAVEEDGRTNFIAAAELEPQFQVIGLGDIRPNEHFTRRDEAPGLGDSYSILVRLASGKAAVRRVSTITRFWLQIDEGDVAGAAFCDIYVFEGYNVSRQVNADIKITDFGVKHHLARTDLSRTSIRDYGPVLNFLNKRETTVIVEFDDAFGKRRLLGGVDKFTHPQAD